MPPAAFSGSLTDLYGSEQSHCAAKAGCDRARDLTAAEVRVAAGKRAPANGLRRPRRRAPGRRSCPRMPAARNRVWLRVQESLLDSFGLATQNGVHVGRRVWKQQRRRHHRRRQRLPEGESRVSAEAARPGSVGSGGRRRGNRGRPHNRRWRGCRCACLGGLRCCAEVGLGGRRRRRCCPPPGVTRGRVLPRRKRLPADLEPARRATVGRPVSPGALAAVQVDDHDSGRTAGDDADVVRRPRARPPPRSDRVGTGAGVLWPPRRSRAPGVCGSSGKAGCTTAAIRSAQRSKKGSRSATGASFGSGSRSILAGSVGECALRRFSVRTQVQMAAVAPNGHEGWTALIVIRRQTQHRRQRKHEMASTQQPRFARTVPA